MFFIDAVPLARAMGTSENGVAHLLDLSLGEAVDLHCRGALAGTPVTSQRVRRRQFPDIMRNVAPSSRTVLNLVPGRSRMKRSATGSSSAVSSSSASSVSGEDEGQDDESTASEYQR